MSVFWMALASALGGFLLGVSVGMALVAERENSTLKVTPQWEVCRDGILGTDVAGKIWCVQGVAK